jgi:diguanylate cyclase (GGDEF)-like protein
MGGDEFAILMEDVEDLQSVVGVAARIVEDAARPIAMKEREVMITASLGIAYAEEGHADVEALLRDADLAMYRAKAAGKNRFVNSSDVLEPAGRDNARVGETVRS